MTNEEAIYCLQSYQPDARDDMCLKCKYYGTVPEEGLEECFVCKSDEARRMAISALEQSESQWILCTDRLPDKECFCLVTVNDGAIYTDLSLFKKDGEFIEHTGDVIAWMPLPEPYQEGRADERMDV